MKNKTWRFDTCKAINMMDFEKVENAILWLKICKKKGKKVFVFGNGGGAGTHFAADLFKMSGMKAICLNDNIPLVSALTNDDGWENVYIEQLKRLVEKDDIIIVFSVHGGKGKDKAGKWSENLTKAVVYAKKRSAKVISIVGFDGGILKKISDICIHIPADSTPIVESIQNLVHHIIAFELNEGKRK